MTSPKIPRPEDVVDALRRTFPDNSVVLSAQQEHNVETSLIQAAIREFVEGDTMIIIDIPSLPERPVSCNERNFYSQRLRMPSDVLRAMGLRKFRDLLLNEKYQRSVRKSHGYADSLPRGVRYVLDLSPSTDEESAMAQLGHLSLTKGLKRWWVTHDLPIAVDGSVVSGHDELCSCWSTMHKNQYLASKSALPDLYDAGKGLWDLKEIPWYRVIPDYCAVRHAVNVIRLLRIFCGHDPVLDSAPRVFTLVGLASMFDIDNSPASSWLRDPVETWLTSYPNQVILEILPEESLKMALSLNLEYPTRCAFAVLVGEMALKEAGTIPPVNPSLSVFGRKLGFLDDDIANAIQHASRALTDRVTIITKILSSADVYTFLGVSQWRKFAALAAQLRERILTAGDQWGRDIIDTVESTLLSFIHNHVSSAYNGAPNDPSIERSRQIYVAEKDLVPLTVVYSRMNITQKTMTAMFWNRMKEIKPSQLGNGSTQFGYNLKTAVYSFNQLVSRAKSKGLIILTPELNSTGSLEIDMDTFAGEFKVGLEQLVERLTTPTHLKGVFLVDRHMPLSQHVLVSLEETEWRFLPLWAGGQDDGSGAVFEAAVPDVVPAPPLMGEDGNEVGRDMERLTLADAETVVSSSMDAQDGNTTVFNRRRVVARDDSVYSEQFSSGGESAFGDARFAVPAEHQTEGQTLASMVEDDGTDTEMDDQEDVSGRFVAL